MPRPRLLWTVSALAAVAFLAGCTSPGIGDTTAGARTPRPAAPVLVSPHGQAARAVRAVDVFARALRDGDVERLFLSPATVKTHLQHLYGKLGVSDRAAAVAEAMRRGLLE